MKLNKIIIFAIFIIILHSPVYAVKTSHRYIQGYGGSNCGPKVLGEVCKLFGIEATGEELGKLSDTRLGKTTMLGLLKAGQAKGIEAVGIKTDLRGLKRLLRQGYQTILYFSKNYHYVLIRDISPKGVSIFNPAMHKKEVTVPVYIFKKNWNGESLVLARGGKTGLLNTCRLMGEDQLNRIIGGDNCANSNADSGNNGGDTSSDPVILNNGNLKTTTNDIFIPGKLPLEIVRTYNAQVVSEVEGWTPTSAWTVEDGEYRGQGDYSIYDGIYGNLDLQLDMQTIEEGENYSYEVGSVSFRYVDRNNRYVFNIQTDGKIELSKFQEGTQYPDLAYETATGYSPLDSNTIRITATDSSDSSQTDIDIYINGTLELEYTDTDPIPAGKVVIESYFCYGTFDNISISDGSSEVYSNDFSVDANGFTEATPGTWTVVDGEYTCESLMDTYKTYTNEQYDNFILELDMETDESYGNPWEVAWLNIRRQDDNNLYYFNIQTDGKIELVKIKDGVSTTLYSEEDTGYDPYDNNSVKITAIENWFQVYINGRKVIDVTDDDPVESGYIVLEAFRSNVRFDNVSIRDGNESYENNFDSVDDSDGIFGRNITYNYGWQAVEHTNGDVTIITDSGRGLVFEPIIGEEGTYESPSDIYDTLTKDSSGYYLTTKHGIVYTFDTEGKFTSITDPNSNQVTITYNTDNHPVTITDTYGRALTLSYNSNGRVSTITDPISRTVSYSYDSNGCLTTVTDPNGNSSTYTYYDNYNLETYTDPEGNTYQYSYYYNDRIYQQTDPEGNVTTFEYLWDTTVVTNNDGESFYYEFYEENDETSGTTDFLGYTNSYEYDANNNITSYTDKSGDTTSYEYDEMGNSTSVTDPLGNERTYGYDSTYNMMTSYTDASGNTTTYDYDSNSNLTKTTDPLANETTITYDSHGNILTITNALGYTTTYTYDSYGHLSTVTDPLGNTITSTYNTIGQLTSREDANGNITSYEYDNNGNITRITDALGNEIVYTYDGNNRKISTTQYNNDGDALTTLYEYDWAGNNTQTIDPGDRRSTSTYGLTNYMHLSMALVTSSSNSCGSCPGETTYYEYDSNGRLIEAEDAMGNITQYSYDITNSLSQITDANGNVTSYTYDEINQLTQITYPDGTTETFSYDSDSNMTSKTDQKGQTVTFEYDELGRDTGKTYPDSSGISYGYDSIGRLTTVTDSSGSITYNYDNADRLTQITYPDGNTIGYSYDNAGNITQLTYPDSSTITYTIDALNRITQIQHSTLGTVVEYTYDSLGRKTTKTLDNSTYTTYSYDDSNNLINLINQTNSGTTISSFEYTYDSSNYNRTSMETLDGTYNYTYDDIYQLTGVTYPDSKAISYSYDNLGNRLTQDNDGLTSSGSFNELNQLTQLLYNGGTAGSNITVRGSIADTYGISSVLVNGVIAEVNNNLFVAEDVPLTEGENTLTAIATDNGGNTTETNISVTLDPLASITYTYDDNGNITSKDVDGAITTYTYDYDNRLIAINNGLSTISYVYDPLGRRIEKNVNGTVTRYIYNGSQIIQETDSTGTIEATYVYGLGIDEPIVMERDGTSYYYYLDGLGSVTDMADSSSNVIEKYMYDPYGEITILDPVTETVRDSSSIGNFYMYTGRQLDEETGLYYYRDRHYDPGVGRFISTDPIGFEDGPNLYTYVHNNPINAIDPTGQEAFQVNEENTSSQSEIDTGGQVYLSGMGYGGSMIIIRPPPGGIGGIDDPICRRWPLLRRCRNRYRNYKRWICLARCNIENYGGVRGVPGYLEAVAYGTTASEACRNAKDAVTAMAPRGTYCRHPHCISCRRFR